MSTEYEPRCPVCHSTKVKGNKVHDKYGWWSRCISGKDHGIYVLEDGSQHEFPENLYFQSAGSMHSQLVETPHGLLTIRKQVRR